ncbi:MAG TPA: hypothetical protein VJZ27_01510, partial [Aggregatilineales bacterium]|nr:hypothetical protein [Aggregatilineales bacterium]
ITRIHVQECLRVARVRPPTPELTSDAMPCALGYFRKDDGSYVIIKAQRTPEGHPQLLYLLVPDIALRWLGGNYRLFESLGYEEMRTFDAPRPNLPPLMLEEPQVLPDEDQIELIYDLFYYCGDNVKNVEGILAALIHSQPITILNSPLSLQQRMGFIQGMLCLLPTPARVGITWMTHSDRSDNTLAQITFIYGDSYKNVGVIYDWDAGQLLTEAPQDKYSRYIASQMRLDASLVLENTRSIARTAVWRAMRQESLPDALHFASRRAAIDSAVSNNQPADRETVAAILRQDPTLSDDMRLLYARHLLAFTIALRDGLEYSEVLPIVAAADRPVAEMIYQQLREVAEGENPLQVIDIVERWMVNIPQAKVIPWYQIAHMAVMNYLESTLRDGNTTEAIDFLSRIQNMHRALQMENVVPQLINIAQGSAAFDVNLAQAIF